MYRDRCFALPADVVMRELNGPGDEQFEDAGDEFRAASGDKQPDGDCHAFA